MRRYPDPSGNLHLSEGDYGQDGSGLWYVRPPRCHPSRLCLGHKVTKHKNETVTVVPSIKISGGSGEIWHGFLIKGLFSEVKSGGGKG